ATHVSAHAPENAKARPAKRSAVAPVAVRPGRGASDESQRPERSAIPAGVDFESAEAQDAMGLLADDAPLRIDLDPSAVKVPVVEDEAGLGSSVGLESVSSVDEDAEAEEEEAEESESGRSEEPSNFLGLYFKEMARLAVLRPEEEF